MTYREIRAIISAFREETKTKPSPLDFSGLRIEHFRIITKNGEEYPITGNELFKVRSTRYNGEYFTAECDFPKGYLGTEYGPIEFGFRNIPNYEEILENITVARDCVDGKRIFEGDNFNEIWVHKNGTWELGKTMVEYGLFYCDYHHRREYDCDWVINGYAETEDFVGNICNDGIAELDLVRCYECGSYFTRNEIYDMRLTYGGDVHLCSNCINNFGECEECGAITRLNGDCLCHECSNDEIYSNLNDYGLKPRPKFRGLIADSVINGYIGFELEIEKVEGETDEYGDPIYNSDDTADYISHYLNRKVYCKHDGSLDDTGIEIVSHPMTLEYLKSCESEFKRCFNELIDDGFRSHNTNDCGLHFHISRTALGDDDETVEARIIYVIEKFWDKLVKFSRRTESQLNSWAKRNSEITVSSIKGDADFDSVKSVSKWQKNGGHGERYHALNVTNRDTIEFRLFRGTLKFETFMASAQLCATIVKYCVEHNNAEMIECTWEDIAHSTNYSELNNYLESRGL